MAQRRGVWCEQWSGVCLCGSGCPRMRALDPFPCCTAWPHAGCCVVRSSMLCGTALRCIEQNVVWCSAVLCSGGELRVLHCGVLSSRDVLCAPCSVPCGMWYVVCAVLWGHRYMVPGSAAVELFPYHFDHTLYGNMAGMAGVSMYPVHGTDPALVYAGDKVRSPMSCSLCSHPHRLPPTPYPFHPSIHPSMVYPAHHCSLCPPPVVPVSTHPLERRWTRRTPQVHAAHTGTRCSLSHHQPLICAPPTCNR
jgi:hypothetical protein